ncbi:hypothetical protein GCM10026988_39090 [Vibrio panuliri]
MTNLLKNSGDFVTFNRTFDIEPLKWYDIELIISIGDQIKEFNFLNDLDHVV